MPAGIQQRPGRGRQTESARVEAFHPRAVDAKNMLDPRQPAAAGPHAAGSGFGGVPFHQALREAVNFQDHNSIYFGRGRQAAQYRGHRAGDTYCAPAAPRLCKARWKSAVVSWS